VLYSGRRGRAGGVERISRIESVVLRPPLCVSVEHVQSTPGNVDVPAGLNQSYQVKYLHCIAAEVHSYPKEVSILNA
jgi:hypothetical protein